MNNSGKIRKEKVIVIMKNFIPVDSALSPSDHMNIENVVNVSGAQVENLDDGCIMQICNVGTTVHVHTV
jgi:hypothetical protein